MIDAKKISEMANCMRSLLKELAALEKSRIKSGDWEASKPSRSRASETARESAIDIRRLTHEAHCIAVELGIADRRADSHYQASTAPAGFGRSFILDRRAPLAPDSDPWHTAVLEQCMLTEACYQEADPAGTVKALIDWHLANGAAVQAVGAAWMSCESRGPWIRNSLKARAEEMRDAEKRHRNSFRKPYMAEPTVYIADAYAEAAAAFEARLAALPAGAGEGS